MARRGGKATAKKRTAKQREEAARKAARNQAGQAESEEEIVSLAQLNPNSNSKRYRDASRLCKEPGCAIPLGYRFGKPRIAGAHYGDLFHRSALLHGQL